MSGRISWTISNLAWVFFFLSSLLRWDFRFLAHSLRASPISLWSSGNEAMASLPSDVNGTFVDATWTRMMAGPKGMPLPPLCSRPYLLQSISEMALVMAQAPCWYSSGTRLANLRIWTWLSEGMSPP